MTYGLRIFNEAGAVQIDERYRNFLLVQEASYAGGAGGTVVTFPSQTTAAPMVFARPHSADHYISSADLQEGLVWVTCAGAFDLRVFGLDSVFSDGSTHGLKVWDAAGNLVFSSQNRAARVKEVVGFDVGDYGPFDTPPGGQYMNFPYTLSHSLGVRPWLCLNTLRTTTGSERQLQLKAKSGTTSITVDADVEFQPAVNTDYFNYTLFRTITNGQFRMALGV